MQTPSKFELVSIDALVPYARNARTHSPEQIMQIRASIREFGFINPILADADGNVLAGHGRLAAATAEGWTTVPVVRVEHLTANQRRAYILADNRLAEGAGWDANMLDVELAELKDAGFDISIAGFDETALSAPIDLDDQPDTAAPAGERCICPKCGFEFYG